MSPIYFFEVICIEKLYFLSAILFICSERFVGSSGRILFGVPKRRCLLHWRMPLLEFEGTDGISLFTNQVKPRALKPTFKGNSH